MRNDSSNRHAKQSALKKIGKPKTWVKYKEKLCNALQKTSSYTKKIRSCKVDKAVYVSTLQRSQQILIDGARIKEKHISTQRNLNSLTSVFFYRFSATIISPLCAFTKIIFAKKPTHRGTRAFDWKPMKKSQ